MNEPNLLQITDSTEKPLAISDNYPVYDLQPRSIIYRGVNNPNKLYNTKNYPSWFSTDKNHDFINDDNRYTFEVIKPIKLINLQNPLIVRLLNRAIDRLSDSELMQFGALISEYHKTFTFVDNNIKDHLKGVYGGISFVRQMQIVHPDILRERTHKITLFTSAIQEKLNEQNYRYSRFEFDQLLCMIIVHIFAKKYKFFEGVMGWIHNEWLTPWHDKYQNLSNLFKTEIAVVVPADTYLNIKSSPTTTTPIELGGGGKLRRVQRHSDKKLKMKQSEVEKKQDKTLPKKEKKEKTESIKPRKVAATKSAKSLPKKEKKEKTESIKPRKAAATKSAKSSSS